MTISPKLNSLFLSLMFYVVYFRESGWAANLKIVFPTISLLPGGARLNLHHITGDQIVENRLFKTSMSTP